MKATNRTSKTGNPVAPAKLTRVEAKAAKPAKKAMKVAEATTDTASHLVTVESLVIAKETESIVAVLRARITPEMLALIEQNIPAHSGDDVPIGMPNAIFCKEAVGVACFAERYWELVDGLDACLAPHKRRLGGDPAPELVYLADPCRQADAMLVQGSLASGDSFPMRAQKLLTEIRTACEVVVDDEVEDKKDVLIVALRKQHASKPTTVGDLTNALASYVTAARSLSPELSELAGFTMSSVEAAQGVVDHLLGRGMASSTRTTRIRRNRLLVMIRNRVAKIRKVARFTFRNYPDILRETASAYSRERRRSAKREEGEGDEDILPEPTEEKTPSDDSSPDGADDV